MSETKIKTAPAKLKVFALVRDENGRPLFDDYTNIAAEIKTALTDADLAFIEDKLKCQ